VAKGAQPIQPGRPERAAHHDELTARAAGLTADIATKSLRRALAMIKEHGPDATVLLLQGVLGPDDQVLEAGLASQPKVEKPAAAG